MDVEKKMTNCFTQHANAVGNEPKLLLLLNSFKIQYVSTSIQQTKPKVDVAFTT